jgi:hypothetical protein
VLAADIIAWHEHCIEYLDQATARANQEQKELGIQFKELVEKWNTRFNNVVRLDVWTVKGKDTDRARVIRENFPIVKANVELVIKHAEGWNLRQGECELVEIAEGHADIEWRDFDKGKDRVLLLPAKNLVSEAAVIKMLYSKKQPEKEQLLNELEVQVQSAADLLTDAHIDELSRRVTSLEGIIGRPATVGLRTNVRRLQNIQRILESGGNLTPELADEVATADSNIQKELAELTNLASIIEHAKETPDKKGEKIKLELEKHWADHVAPPPIAFLDLDKRDLEYVSQNEAIVRANILLLETHVQTIRDTGITTINIVDGVEPSLGTANPTETSLNIPIRGKLELVALNKATEQHAELLKSQADLIVDDAQHEWREAKDIHIPLEFRRVTKVTDFEQTKSIVANTAKIYDNVQLLLNHKAELGPYMRVAIVTGPTFMPRAEVMFPGDHGIPSLIVPIDRALTVDAKGLIEIVDAPQETEVAKGTRVRNEQIAKWEQKRLSPPLLVFDGIEQADLEDCAAYKDTILENIQLLEQSIETIRKAGVTEIAFNNRTTTPGVYALKTGGVTLEMPVMHRLDKQDIENPVLAYSTQNEVFAQWQTRSSMPIFNYAGDIDIHHIAENRDTLKTNVNTLLTNSDPVKILGVTRVFATTRADVTAPTILAAQPEVLYIPIGTKITAEQLKALANAKETAKATAVRQRLTDHWPTLDFKRPLTLALDNVRNESIVAMEKNIEGNMAVLVAEQDNIPEGTKIMFDEHADLPAYKEEFGLTVPASKLMAANELLAALPERKHILAVFTNYPNIGARLEEFGLERETTSGEQQVFGERLNTTLQAEPRVAEYLSAHPEFLELREGSAARFHPQTGVIEIGAATGEAGMRQVLEASREFADKLIQIEQLANEWEQSLHANINPALELELRTNLPLDQNVDFLLGKKAEIAALVALCNTYGARMRNVPIITIVPQAPRAIVVPPRQATERVTLPLSVDIATLQVQLDIMLPKT